MAEYGLEYNRNAPPLAVLADWFDWWPTPFHKAIEVSGYGGLGIDWPHFTKLWVAIPIFCFFFGFGLLLKKVIFPRLAIALGMNPSAHIRQRKFANQLWLFLFYTCNTIFGCYVMHDKPWFHFPPYLEHQHGFFHDFPHEPEYKMVLYFACGLAFYTSEMASLFIETRRSDFTEYFMHHVATMTLLLLGFAGRDHPMGGYVMLIHDASDIFLCLAKSAHYVNYQTIVNTSFAIFVAGFIFFRFVCLPMVVHSCFYVAPVVRKAAVSFYILVILLTFILQLLHFYWFYLILRMIYRLICGVKGDTRSDSDKDDSESVKKARKGKGKNE